jgi:hypothetical protein
MTDREATAIPAELRSTPPRKVLLTGAGWYDICLGSAFVVIALGLMGYLYSKVIHELTTRNDLRQNSSETTGQITQHWFAAMPRSGGVVNGIDYAFSVDGNTFTGKSSVPEGVWESLQNADDVSIKYFPSDPNINHPAAWEASPGPVGLPLIFGLIALPGFGVYKRLLKKRRMVIGGVAALARITNCVSDRGGYHLEFEFRTENGDLLVCDRSGSRREIGSTVWLLYWPANPVRTAFYPIDAFQIQTGSSQ